MIACHMMQTTTTPRSHASRAHDIWRKLPRPLDAMLHPRALAVVGATEAEGSVGRTLLENLERGGFPGSIYPINPKRDSVLGVKAYASIAALPERVDLAVIVTPAPTVPGIVRQCVRAGVPGAIIISAGFKECGARGAEFERQVLAEAARGRIRLLGPNCLGGMAPYPGLK